MSWQRMYRIGKTSVSPLDWKDPLDPTKCRVRGYKSRGKGRGKIEADDTYIKISEDGMYPIFKFLMWYTKPLVSLVGERSKDSLWLYFGKRGVNDCSITDRFLQSAQAFLDRHEIWDVHVGANGEVSNRRLASLDSRRFRKVYAAKEMMKAINEAQSHQELAASLTHALKHKQFDTTLGSYLSWAPRKPLRTLEFSRSKKTTWRRRASFAGFVRNTLTLKGSRAFMPPAPIHRLRITRSSRIGERFARSTICALGARRAGSSTRICPGLPNVSFNTKRNEKRCHAKVGRLHLAASWPGPKMF